MKTADRIHGPLVESIGRRRVRMAVVVWHYATQPVRSTDVPCVLPEFGGVGLIHKPKHDLVCLRTKGFVVPQQTAGFGHVCEVETLSEFADGTTVPHWVALLDQVIDWEQVKELERIVHRLLVKHAKAQTANPQTAMGKTAEDLARDKARRQSLEAVTLLIEKEFPGARNVKTKTAADLIADAPELAINNPCALLDSPKLLEKLGETYLRRSKEESPRNANARRLQWALAEGWERRGFYLMSAGEIVTVLRAQDNIDVTAAAVRKTAVRKLKLYSAKGPGPATKT